MELGKGVHVKNINRSKTIRRLRFLRLRDPNTAFDVHLPSKRGSRELAERLGNGSIKATESFDTRTSGERAGHVLSQMGHRRLPSFFNPTASFVADGRRPGR